jgi:hypothetical protein
MDTEIREERASAFGGQAESDFVDSSVRPTHRSAPATDRKLRLTLAGLGHAANDNRHVQSETIQRVFDKKRTGPFFLTSMTRGPSQFRAVIVWNSAREFMARPTA